MPYIFIFIFQYLIDETHSIWKMPNQLRKNMIPTILLFGRSTWVEFLRIFKNRIISPLFANEYILNQQMYTMSSSQISESYIYCISNIRFKNRVLKFPRNYPCTLYTETFSAYWSISTYISALYASLCLLHCDILINQ